MPVITVDDMDGWARAHLAATEPARISQEVQKYTDYFIVPTWFKQDRVQFTDNVDRFSQLVALEDLADAGGAVPLQHKDQVHQSNNLREINIRLVGTQFDYSWAYYEEQVDSRRRLLNLINQRESQMNLWMIEHFETAGLRLPTVGSQIEANGIPYWVVWDQSVPQTFGGKNPTGFSDVAGLDTSLPAYKRYRNWTDNFTDITAGDAIEKMAIAAQETDFKAPLPWADERKSAIRHVVLTTKKNVIKMQQLKRTQNDNLGSDLGYGQNGSMTFMMRPIIGVPAFTPDDRDTAAAGLPTDVIFMLDLGKFYPVACRRYWFKRTGPLPIADEHDVRAVFSETKYNYFCESRRRQTVLGRV